MKKILFGTLAAATVLCIGATGAFAAGPSFSSSDTVRNDDGICDYQGSGSRMRNFVDADGDGVCDYLGSGSCLGGGRMRNYVDADGDGICDHVVSTATGQGNGFHGGHCR